jgi:hypothetical protein
MGFELKKHIYLHREKQPLKMDVMVRPPKGSSNKG